MHHALLHVTAARTRIQLSSPSKRQVEYNLYGMGFIRLAKAQFRGPLPEAGAPRRAGWAALPEVQSPETESSGETGFIPLVAPETAGSGQIPLNPYATGSTAQQSAPGVRRRRLNAARRTITSITPA